jgi:hypothetical protein
MHVLWIIPWNTVSSREMNPRSINSASHKVKEQKSPAVNIVSYLIRNLKVKEAEDFARGPLVGSSHTWNKFFLFPVQPNKFSSRCVFAIEIEEPPNTDEPKVQRLSMKEREHNLLNQKFLSFSIFFQKTEIRLSSYFNPHNAGRAFLQRIFDKELLIEAKNRRKRRRNRGARRRTFFDLEQRLVERLLVLLLELLQQETDIQGRPRPPPRSARAVDRQQRRLGDRWTHGERNHAERGGADAHAHYVRTLPV